MQSVIIKLITWYQHFSKQTPSHCRYYPTCSHYTQTAVTRFGVVRGVLMGLSRILRCQPFIKGGIDPVPQKFTLFRNRNSAEIAKASENYYGETAQQNRT
ncbi:membrane protein insertion efficiency factor YidD [Loigolactobacillus zhaoyuanensis]|uniref:Putative membrane protein insertion efficiency factor n=1 Tax=Loigolactobacillus zhaoyuanensis TaxID=2486017 RepID=A0ABW8UCI3_9LACO|nr:membrane protein insertion efficiency factor YidD [Loigolactobacillus zhaoyuanensis]